MADVLLSWLRALPAARRERLASSVDTSPSGVSELARRLRDPARVASLLTQLGEGAGRTLQRLARAAQPLRRDDLASLEGADGAALLEALEEGALVCPVERDGARADLVASTVRLPTQPLRIASREITLDETHALIERSQRRDMEWALLLGRLCQHPPRITRSGELHAADLKLLALQGDDRLSSGWVTSTCGALFEAGALGIDSGRVLPTTEALADPAGVVRRVIWQALAGALRDDDPLRALLTSFAKGDVWSLRELRESCEQACLVARASAVERPRGSCRREVESLVGAVVGNPALVVTSLQQAPEEPFVAMDRTIVALLGGLPLPVRPTRDGFVLPSFEVVATAECDPAAVACVAACAQLLQWDHAVRWQLTPDSVAAGGAAGVTSSMLVPALTMLSGGRVDAGVVRSISAWLTAAATPAAVSAPIAPTAEEVLISAARDALSGSTQPCDGHGSTRTGDGAGESVRGDDLDPLDDLLDAPSSQPSRR